MQTLLRIVSALSAAMLISIAAPVFAESAPVYDADTMQDGADQDQGPASQAQAQEVAPGASVSSNNNQDEGFVPAQQMRDSSPSSASMGTEQRLKRIEQKLNALQPTDVNNRIESLQNEVQTLRGQVEDLTHQLQQAQSQQKSMYDDLDKRLSKSGNQVAPTNVADNNKANDQTTGVPIVSEDNVLSKIKAKAAKEKADADAALAAKGADADAKPKPQPNVAEEQQIYQTAYNLIKAKKYKEATTTLQNMLQKYPSGQFASNAHYWLGELYGLMGNNGQALSEFDAVVKIFPDSPRVSDAQLKVGLIFASQSKWQEAKNAFKKVINRYPGTASARLASEQLKQIKDAGH